MVNGAVIDWREVYSLYVCSMYYQMSILLIFSQKLQFKGRLGLLLLCCAYAYENEVCVSCVGSPIYTNVICLNQILFQRLQSAMSGIISIQGNLGAGKTTLLSFLNISSIKEPVDEWENVGGINVLKNYYEDPKRWAFTFQLNAIHSRNTLWKMITAQQPDRLHYSERSPLADRYVFGEIMYRQGNLDTAEYAIYSEVCEAVIKQCPLKAIIYLKCSPELCLERIKQRGRKGEEGIGLEYLRKVHERHEEWLQNINNTIPIITIDTGVYDVYKKEDQDQIRNKINEFIHKIDRMGRPQSQTATSALNGQKVVA